MVEKVLDFSDFQQTKKKTFWKKFRIITPLKVNKKVNENGVWILFYFLKLI